MRKTLMALTVLLAPLGIVHGLPNASGEGWAPIDTCRSGMQRTLDSLRKGGFSGKELLPADQREALKGTWKSFLDYVFALDVEGLRLRAGIERKGAAAKEVEANKALSYAAFLSQYRCSLEFLKALEKVPGADTLLNEAMPELGLPKETFAAFKFRFLNVAQAAKFTALQAAGWKGTAGGPWSRQIKEDEKALWRMGLGKGTAMTLENGKAILAKGIFNAWFPAQKGVSEWMGDTKVWRVHDHLISGAQAKALGRKLQPGDILFTRHEWYLSNLGLPGFWSHAAIYLGTPEERRAFFDDPEVKRWIQGQGGQKDLEAHLKASFSRAYRAMEKSGGRVLEAVSEGVVFTPWEKFCEADSLSALRPRLSKVEKARALVRAFRYAGRPYDFNFDFRSDDTLVCSELVYKAYEPARGFQGMTFPLQRMAGRVVSSPNGMVEQFAEQYGTKGQQSDLVVFLDGHEKEGKAVEPGLREFRRSWKRPKWDVFLQ